MKQEVGLPDILISKMSKDDLDSVMSIQKDCHLSFWGLADYEKELSLKDSIALIAKQDEVQKGFLIMRLIILSSEAELYNIAVAKNVARQGIGRNLLESSIKICLARKIKYIWLEVRQTNMAAINFYKSFNFIVVNERKNFYTHPTEDALIMRLDLTG